MKAVTVVFKQENNYDKLTEVLKASWARNAYEHIPLHVYEVDPPKLGPRDPSFYWNHKKLRHWIDSVDQDTIFLDCDMLCMADISSVLKEIDCIGITERPGPYRYNGGVIFVKYTPKAQAFLERWYRIDEMMLNDEVFHRPYLDEFAGLNQSSLGWMMKNGYHDWVKIYPDEYNLCDGWNGWQQAKMIHVKGNLRERVLRPQKEYTENIEAIAEIWETYFEMSTSVAAHKSQEIEVVEL